MGRENELTAKGELTALNGQHGKPERQRNQELWNSEQVVKNRRMH